MNDATEYLKQARVALIAFEPDKAEEMLRKFEAELQNHPLTEDAATRCTAELSAIRDLAASAREGVFAAQRQFQEILKLSRHLDGYDKTGKKTTEQVGPRSTRKF
ncbi:hypothetical protein [Paracoccus lutimaris]|uniref:Uncharacterized protein n=1 Tax=Paracoccus lutimaris TaxID=1490030 RepID=A0A368YKJ3_9RHOB|nr:hypothetical protein [Paracoccus lutimaris]RCW80761.1 hypothetical protein DFP89_1176 [Paracoccus lutimaris]